MFRWCLGHVSVVSWSCLDGVSFPKRLSKPRQLRVRAPPYVGPACFGGVSVLLWRWFADILVVSRFVAVVSRSQSLCVCELCSCMSIHLAHRVYIILRVDIVMSRPHEQDCFA